MDQGRHGDDGPEEVEAAPDRDTIDLTAGGDRPTAAAARTEPETDATTEVVAEADDRPDAWLADIRARAPWLLEPGGALHRWVADPEGPEGPDVVPHGVATPDLSFGAAEALHPAEPSRHDTTSWPWPERPTGEVPQIDLSAAGGTGPPAAAGGPRGHEVRATWSAAILHPAGTPVVPPSVGEARHGAGTPPDPFADPEARDGATPSAPAPLLPAIDQPRPPAGLESVPPETLARSDGPPAPSANPLPALDQRRPAIQRPSATWPPPPAQAAAPTPVWQTGSHPEGAGLPRPGPIPEPSRPLSRPITPFVPDRPGPTSPTGRHVTPTWADDRSGWHPAAVAVTRIVDESALSPWPSLLDDDDGDEDAPDWSVLERGFDRMLRLDREQRRR